MAEAQDRVSLLRTRIADAVRRVGRQDCVTLLAVSKRFPVTAVEAVRRAGVLDFGENYVQEAKEKAGAVSGVVRWHLIGGLQRNKAKAAVALFDLIQSVDSNTLAQSLNRHAAEQNTIQDILVQVNLSHEPGRGGVLPEEALALCEAAADLPHLRLCGMMGVPPDVDADAARVHFRTLKGLFDMLPTENRQILSMGMSGDFETAIEEGSTLVRIGTALFGQRQT